MRLDDGDSVMVSEHCPYLSVTVSTSLSVPISLQRHATVLIDCTQWDGIVGRGGGRETREGGRGL